MLLSFFTFLYCLHCFIAHSSWGKTRSVSTLSTAHPAFGINLTSPRWLFVLVREEQRCGSRRRRGREQPRLHGQASADRGLIGIQTEAKEDLERWASPPGPIPAVSIYPARDAVHLISLYFSLTWPPLQMLRMLVMPALNTNTDSANDGGCKALWSCAWCGPSFFLSGSSAFTERATAIQTSTRDSQSISVCAVL